MSQKIAFITDIGEITLVKRRGSRNLRLSFNRDGSVRVSLPTYVPYQAGIEFARGKLEWIIKHRPIPSSVLSEGERVGKAHRLRFAPSQTAKQASVRVSKGVINVSYPMNMTPNSKAVQKAAERGALKALKTEADQLLPGRLDDLAVRHGFSYKSVVCKRLSSRWGSCSHQKEIILNTYLMQLPWDIIDYVILHELVHTQHLNHGQDFWDRFEEVLPDAKARRKLLKAYKTAVTAVQ